MNPFAATEEPAAPDAVDRPILARELQTAVTDAIARLPEALRLVYVLTEQEGMSYQQVAEVLACPVGTVGSRKVEAVRRLRELLQPWRDGLHGAGPQ